MKTIQQVITECTIELNHYLTRKNWTDIEEESIADCLECILPNGAGIDSDWQIEFLKNGNILCHNSYHCMNQIGYYDGWIDFYVKLYRHRVNEYRVLQGPMQGRVQVVHRKGDIDFKIVGAFHLRWNKYIDVKDYLYDCIGYALRDIITHRNEIL